MTMLNKHLYKLLTVWSLYLARFVQTCLMCALLGTNTKDAPLWPLKVQTWLNSIQSSLSAASVTNKESLNVKKQQAFSDILNDRSHSKGTPLGLVPLKFQIRRINIQSNLSAASVTNKDSLNMNKQGDNVMIYYSSLLTAWVYKLGYL